MNFEPQPLSFDPNTFAAVTNTATGTSTVSAPVAIAPPPIATATGSSTGAVDETQIQNPINVAPLQPPIVPPVTVPVPVSVVPFPPFPVAPLPNPLGDNVAFPVKPIGTAPLPGPINADGTFAPPLNGTGNGAYYPPPTNYYPPTNGAGNGTGNGAYYPPQPIYPPTNFYPPTNGAGNSAGNGGAYYPPTLPSTYPVAYPTIYPPAPMPYNVAALPFPMTPVAFVQEFYRHLCILDEFFSTRNMRYWLTGGTLLGQVRERDFIKWDTNNDLGVLIDNEADGELLLRSLKAFLLSNAEFSNLAIWRSTHGLKLISKNLTRVGTDIYFYRKLNDGRVVLTREKSRKQWPKDCFFAWEVDAPMLMPFGPLHLRAPADPVRYLKSVYGPKVMTHARLGTFDHFTNGARVGPKHDFALFQ